MKQSRSWRKTSMVVTLSFAAVVFATFAMDQDEGQAQESPKAKNKKKDKDYAPKSKNLPVAKSLTDGKQVDAVALAKLIDQEINKRIKAERATSSGLATDEEFIRRVYLDIVGVIPS